MTLCLFFIEKNGAIRLKNSPFIYFDYFISLLKCVCACVCVGMSSNTTLNLCHFNIRVYIRQLIKGILKEAWHHHIEIKSFIIMNLKEGKHLFLLYLFPFQGELIQGMCSNFMKCYETYI